MAVKLELWGNYALFTRPEMKTERVSYDVMTPSAARGILEAIYWHPGMRWVVTKIQVCAPIEFTNIRRNEVKSKININTVKKAMEHGQTDIYLLAGENRTQRSSIVLKNVHYIVEAHFEMTEKASESDNPGKFQDIMMRRVKKGQFYHQPCFGCREFPVNFKLCEEVPDCPDSLKGRTDLGYMLYDMDYSDPENIKPLFFRAVLNDGVLAVPDRDSEEVQG